MGPLNCPDCGESFEIKKWRMRHSSGPYRKNIGYQKYRLSEILGIRNIRYQKYWYLLISVLSYQSSIIEKNSELPLTNLHIPTYSSFG